MGKVYYNKLIRDNIKDKIIAKGEQCEVRAITDDAEFEQELMKKVVAEARGLIQVCTREEFLDEYADLMAVLDALLRHQEFSEADVKVAIEKNVAEKGLFANKHFLHWSSDSAYRSNETFQGLHITDGK